MSRTKARKNPVAPANHASASNVGTTTAKTSAAVALNAPLSAALSVQRTLGVSVPLQAAIVASLIVHATVVFGVGFKVFDPKKFAPPHNVMDVVLVNSKSAEKPLKADALAQANLDGGGNTDLKLRAATPMPLTDQRPNNPKPGEDRVTQLENEMRQLMTQAKSTVQVVQGELAVTPAGKPAPLSADELVQRSIEIARLEAQLQREYQAYQERPKRKFIGARTSEYRFAQYVDGWKLKIERVGNLNYPEEAKTRKLYGALQLTVAIKSNGEVEEIQVNRSSGHKLLDEAAVRIVRLSAPFERFPDKIKQDTDILHITRTWQFSKGDQLVAQ